MSPSFHKLPFQDKGMHALLCCPSANSWHSWNPKSASFTWKEGTGLSQWSDIPSWNAQIPQETFCLHASAGTTLCGSFDLEKLAITTQSTCTNRQEQAGALQNNGHDIPCIALTMQLGPNCHEKAVSKSLGVE
jgi:hypothetical protein